MLNIVKFAWAEHDRELLEQLQTMKDCELDSYEALFKLSINVVLNRYCAKHDLDFTFNIDKIHEIDDGGYQGTLIFVGHLQGYQPSPSCYFMSTVDYGSCSACDTLQGIFNCYTMDKHKDLLTLCKDMLTEIVFPYYLGNNQYLEQATV